MLAISSGTQGVLPGSPQPLPSLAHSLLATNPIFSCSEISIPDKELKPSFRET